MHGVIHARSRRGVTANAARPFPLTAASYFIRTHKDRSLSVASGGVFGLSGGAGWRDCHIPHSVGAAQAYYYR